LGGSSVAFARLDSNNYLDLITHVPDGRRLGHVNVLCVILIACGQEGGEKRANRDWAEDPKVGQLTLSMGPARAEVYSYVQRATIPSKRIIYTLSIHKVPHMQ
jgi:hypothetical protein